MSAVHTTGRKWYSGILQIRLEVTELQNIFLLFCCMNSLIHILEIIKFCITQNGTDFALYTLQDGTDFALYTLQDGTDFALYRMGQILHCAGWDIFYTIHGKTDFAPWWVCTIQGGTDFAPYRVGQILHHTEWERFCTIHFTGWDRFCTIQGGTDFAQYRVGQILHYTLYSEIDFDVQGGGRAQILYFIQVNLKQFEHKIRL